MDKSKISYKVRRNGKKEKIDATFCKTQAIFPSFFLTFFLSFFLFAFFSIFFSIFFHFSALNKLTLLRQENTCTTINKL